MKKLMCVICVSVCVFCRKGGLDAGDVLIAESREMESQFLDKLLTNEHTEDVSCKTDHHRRTVLMHAAYSGNGELVSKFVNSAKKMQDENGKTALMLAAQNGHTDIVSMLIEYESGMRDK